MFPKYKEVGWWIFKTSEPDGWEDLGQMDKERRVDGKGRNLVSTDVHDFCKTAIHIGREEGRPFRFCPRCLVETEYKYPHSKLER